MSGPAETADMATPSFATATAAAMRISRISSSSKNDEDDNDVAAVVTDDEISNSLQEPLLPLTATNTATTTVLPPIALEVGGQSGTYDFKITKKNLLIV
jgi:hypothetical protein